MKPIHSGLFHSILCSMMLRRANIWSVHPFPLRKPACFWCSLASIAPSILFSKPLQNSLLGTDSNVIPLQLSQCWRSLFYSFTIRPLFHLLVITSFVHISLKRSVKTLSAKCMSVLSISVQMFPAFNCCIACVTYCSVGTPVAISRSSFIFGVWGQQLL